MFSRTRFFASMASVAATAAAAGGTKSAAPTLEEQYATAGSGIRGGPDRRRTSLQVALAADGPGALCDLLLPFKEAGINISQVANRPRPFESTAEFRTIFLDVNAHIDDPGMKEILERLRQVTPNITVTGSWVTPWYPTQASHLDQLDQSTLAAGEELQDDPNNPHPGFHDAEYRARRRHIVSLAKGYKSGTPIPVVDYTAEENRVWTVVFDHLTKLYPTHACEAYNYVLPLMIESGVISRTKMPQLAAVSQFLSESTGFMVRPVAGLLSSRDFLNALAFRIFFSTQYIRHGAQPLYTPEPDMVHDILGHLPLLADPDFALFTQTIGLASLGADDELLDKLAKLYWFSVEFGLCMQNGKRRVYGAGILSSAGELQYALNGENGAMPQYLPWDPYVASKTEFPITKYQPTYFVADSFKDAQVKLENWVREQEKPFFLTYNAHTRQVNSYPKNTWSMVQEHMRKLQFEKF